MGVCLVSRNKKKRIIPPINFSNCIYSNTSDATIRGTATQDCLIKGSGYADYDGLYLNDVHVYGFTQGGSVPKIPPFYIKKGTAVRVENRFASVGGTLYAYSLS